MLDILEDTIKCGNCERPLSGGLDTFGRCGQEQCQDCFLGGDTLVTVIGCPGCDGDGQVKHSCDCDLCDVDTEDCADCDGEGKLRKEEMSIEGWRLALNDHRHLQYTLNKKRREIEMARLSAWNEAV